MATNNHKWRTYDKKETDKLDTIRKKQLSWYGHVSRLDEQTPAQTALKHVRSNNRMKKLRGGHWNTWIKNLEKDLDDLRLHPQENLTELIQDRSVWRKRKRCKQTLAWFLHRKWRRHRRRCIDSFVYCWSLSCLGYVLVIPLIFPLCTANPFEWFNY